MPTLNERKMLSSNEALKELKIISGNACIRCRLLIISAISPVYELVFYEVKYLTFYASNDVV